ncbi:MAG: hypothetical protein VYD77_01640 [Actinomycetota bacterium]|nr:hypothetical protein [Actinomycetota bacterium]
MNKLNLKKPFIIAVAACSLFAGAIVAVPLIASAQNSVVSLVDERPGKMIDDESKGKHNRGQKDSKRDKGRHILREVIESIGLDKETLKTGFENGQTLGEVAEANGTDPATVVETLVTLMTEHLNEAVAKGKITGEKALELASGIQEKAERIVNRPLDESKGKHNRGQKEKLSGPHNHNAR